MLVLTAMIFVAILVPPMVAVPARAYIPCEPTFSWLSGTVYDQEGNGLGGVVVKLYTEYPNQQYNGQTTTNGVGQWSALLQDCGFYDADFYWKTATGPYLLHVEDIAFSGSAYTLTVWRQAVELPFMWEFPNDPTITIKFTVGAELRFSADAKVFGTIPIDFLSLNLAGKVGADIVVGVGFTFTGTAPYYVSLPLGTKYRVVDVSGNWVEYVDGAIPQSLWSGDAVEYLTMANAIARDKQAGLNPYVQVAGRGKLTRTLYFSGSITVDIEVSVKAILVGLTTHASVKGTLSTSWGITFDNSAQKSNACYVLYQQGPFMHAYKYSQKRCP